MINVVCAVIQDDEGRVLAFRRSPGKAMAGKWEFPGGKIQDGEEASDALTREIDEELGCKIDIGGQLPDVVHHYPKFSIRLTPFCCRLDERVMQLSDHSESRWVALDECGDLDWAEADIPIWERLQSLGG